MPPEQPDWHGNKEKRKSRSTSRRTMTFSFFLGFGLAVLVAGVVGFVIIEPLKAQLDRFSALGTDGLYRGPPTYTPSPQFAWTTEAPSPTPDLTDRLFEFEIKPGIGPGPELVSYREWERRAEPNYHFQGVRYSPDGRLFVAHVSNQQDSLKCDPNRKDGYWAFISNEQGYGLISHRVMINPTQTAFDDAMNIYIAAADCETGNAALFKFDNNFQLVDTIETPGKLINAIAVTHAGRLFVAVSPITVNTEYSEHLLEFASESDTGKLIQGGAYAALPNTTRYTAMILTPSDDKLYLLRKDDYTAERLQMVLLKDSPPTFTEIIAYHIYDGINSQTDLQYPLTDLAWRNDGTLLGLDAKTTTVYLFSSIGLKPTLIPSHIQYGGSYHALGIYSKTDHIILAGRR